MNIKKEINSILYERLASPFWFLLFSSWCIWNWKSLYITFFVSEEFLKSNKLDYILNNLNPSISTTLIYPLISTVVLLTFGEWINNIAYKVYMCFKKRRREIKQDYDDSKRLSETESNEIRFQSLKLRQEILSLTQSKDSEIQDLCTKLDNLDEELNKSNSDFSALKVKFQKDVRDLSPRNIFIGQWAYKIEGEDAIEFLFPDNYNIEFANNRENRMSFRVIQNYANKELLIYMGESNYEDIRREYIIWEIKRQENIEMWKGIMTNVDPRRENSNTSKRFEIVKINN